MSYGWFDFDWGDYDFWECEWLEWIFWNLYEWDDWRVEVNDECCVWIGWCDFFVIVVLWMGFI